MDIIRFSLSASLLVSMVIILRIVFGNRLPKMAFKVLWIIVLFKLLIPVNLPSDYSVYNLFEQKSVSTDNAGINENVKGPENSPAIPIAPFFPEAITAGSIDVNNYELTGNISLSDFMNYLLISGGIVIFSTALIIHFKHRRVYVTSLPCDNEKVLKWTQSNKLFRKYSVRTLDTISTPLTYGLFKPVILLPSSLEFDNERQINYILRHEFIHIKRFDVLWKTLFFAALAVHWFNPLVWIAFVLMNRDIELSCDEEVIKHIGAESKLQYAETLLNLTQRRKIPFLLNAFSTNLTKERIKSIMKYRKISVIGALVSVIIIISVITVFATNASVLSEENDSSYTLSEEAPSETDENDVQEQEVEENAVDLDENMDAVDLDENAENEIEETENDEVLTDIEFIFPVNSGVISEFGYWDGGYGRHSGIDIVTANDDKEILAAADGEVVFADWKSGYGFCVIIEHENGLQTLYAHCSEFLVEVGDYVRQGETIALIGVTGIAAYEHLHFEVRNGGVIYNPMDYFN